MPIRRKKSSCAVVSYFHLFTKEVCMHLKFFVICVFGFFLLGASAFAAGPVQAQDNTAANKKTTSSAKSAEKSLRKIITGRVASVNVGKKEIGVELKGKKYPISIDG